MSDIKRILCLDPHCDDLEFAAGGTISSYIGKKVDLYMAIFSFCDNITNSKNECGNILRKEMYNSIAKLNLKEDKVISFNFPVRNFPEHRQGILEEMINLKRELNPDMVILPSSYDIHQDHEVIFNEGVRAFKHSRIIGYEMPWNNLKFSNDLYIEISEKDLENKINAINEYKSQVYRGHSDEEFYIGLAKVRGAQIGVKYAETFEVIRWII